MTNVHLGNVAEFSEKFGLCEHHEDRRNVRLECDVYASLATFLTTDPGIVVLAVEWRTLGGGGCWPSP